MSIEKNIDQIIIHFKGGDMAVGAGKLTYADGRKIPYFGIQQIQAAQEIGSDVKGVPLFGTRVYLAFDKIESINVVIEGLEKLKESFAPEVL